MTHRMESSRAAIDWSLLSSGGEASAILEAVSRDQVSLSLYIRVISSLLGQVDFGYDIATFPTIDFESENYNTRGLSGYLMSAKRSALMEAYR